MAPSGGGAEAWSPRASGAGGGLGGLVLAAQGLQGQAGSAGARVPHELPEKGAGQATPGVPRGTLAVGRGSAFVLRALSAFL